MKTKARRDALQAALKTKATPRQVSDIRDAYYNAVCGLKTLADALEAAAEDGDCPLLDEHFTAIEALDLLNLKSDLGAIL